MLVVDDQLDLGLVADELHGVPLEVVELHVEGRRHFTLASPEIDMNLKTENVNNIIWGAREPSSKSFNILIDAYLKSEVPAILKELMSLLQK